MLCYKVVVFLAYWSKLHLGDKCILILKLSHLLLKNTEQLLGHRLALLFSNLPTHYFTPQVIT